MERRFVGMTQNNFIVTPVGGFMNHIRWLMLLDSKFSINKIVDSDFYKKISGTSWPKISDIESDSVSWDDQSLIGIKDEILSTGLFLNLTSLDSKLDFILTHVYPDTRTWHNWLMIEITYRDVLNSLIVVSHEHNVDMIKPGSKLLICKCDAELAYKSYLKLNSNLNKASKEGFIKLNRDFCAEIQELEHNTTVKITDSTVLFQPTLDRNFYNELIDWFELDDNYKYAQQIHTAWYNSHKRAEKEFVKDITELYKE